MVGYESVPGLHSAQLRTAVFAIHNAVNVRSANSVVQQRTEYKEFKLWKLITVI